MDLRALVVSQLADSILLCGFADADADADGDSAKAITIAMSRTLGLSEATVRPVARALAKDPLFQLPAKERKSLLVEWLHINPLFMELWHRHSPRIRRWPLQPYPPEQKPGAGQPSRWGVPPLANANELAAWLNLSPADLIWFSQKYKQRTGCKPLRHYHHHFMAKSNGDLRLLETPKQRTKLIQQKIHQQILRSIPVHGACHGFVGGRSIKSYVQPHVAKAVVIAMDLKLFFLSVSVARVFHVFRYLGYNSEVSGYLKGLCVTKTPPDILTTLDLQQQSNYLSEHLPQGAPTSPMLANLVAFRLDQRLSALAKQMNYEYSRYADDLAFSAYEFNPNQIRRLINSVTQIVSNEGFHINTGKTRIMTASQQQRLTGIVINEKINIAKPTLKRFEALLYNCVRFGPKSQNTSQHPNFAAHLEGRLAFYRDLVPHKVEKFYRLYDQIQWD